MYLQVLVLDQAFSVSGVIPFQQAVSQIDIFSGCDLIIEKKSVNKFIEPILAGAHCPILSLFLHYLFFIDFSFYTFSYSDSKPRAYLQPQALTSPNSAVSLYSCNTFRPPLQSKSLSNKSRCANSRALN